MTNNLQELRELIIKANHPELNYAGAIDKMYPKALYDYDAEIYDYIEKVDEEHQIYHEGKMLINEIAPRINISLALVLIATEDKHYGLDVCEEDPKCIWIYTAPYMEWCRWDLTKDLDNQSSDTIDSLLKLIKGE